VKSAILFVGALFIIGHATAATVPAPDKEKFMESCLEKANQLATAQTRAAPDYCKCTLDYVEKQMSDADWKRLDTELEAGKTLDSWSRGTVNKIAGVCAKQ
jgi:hypothetical protein